MNLPLTPSLGKLPATLLLCAALAACSSMQKSSSGTGTQEAVPISEAGKTDAGATSPEAGASGSSSAVTTTTAPSETASSSAPTATTPGKGDEEAERLRKQLADQEAEINRMRDDQVSSQRLAEEEAARQRSVEDAAPTGSSSQQQQSAAAGQPQSSPGAAAGSQSASAPTAAAGAAAGTAGAESASGSDSPMAGQPLQRSVYFEFDAATIAEQYDSMLVGHAAFLQTHPDFNVEVQGNCDERGSREYNLALGARRAEAVKRALELAGADGGKIKTVSFGAEKPVAFGQDEESYRQNRRADIQY